MSNIVMWLGVMLRRGIMILLRLAFPLGLPKQQMPRGRAAHWPGFTSGRGLGLCYLRRPAASMLRHSARSHSVSSVQPSMRARAQVAQNCAHAWNQHNSRDNENRAAFQNTRPALGKMNHFQTIRNHSWPCECGLGVNLVTRVDSNLGQQSVRHARSATTVSPHWSQNSASLYLNFAFVLVER